jgi:hypothetical protein
MIKENCENGPNSTEITQENLIQVVVLKGQKCEIVVTPGFVVHVFSPVFSVKLCSIFVLTDTGACDGFFGQCNQYRIKNKNFKHLNFGPKLSEIFFAFFVFTRMGRMNFF